MGQGLRWWWYVVAAGLIIAGLLTLVEVARQYLLPAAWLWPILAWSALGAREIRHHTEGFIFSAAYPLRRQLPAVLAVLLGASFPSAETIAAWPGALFITFPIYLILITIGEETGWRGFVMPRLQEKHSALTASLILAVVVSLWHLPLVLFNEDPFNALPLMLITFGAQFILTWLANQVEGKVLIVMLAHAAQGGLGGEYFGSMFTGPDAVLERWLLTAIFWVVALGIVLLTGSTLTRRQPTEAAAMTARS